MTKSNDKPANGTAEKILDISEHLLQSRGFNAMSYRDISEALGLRKASIHYHFPSKSDLGAAVMARYRERLEVAMSAADPHRHRSAWELLEFYFQPYLSFAGTPDKVCLSGSLAGEFPALPRDMQRLVAAFFLDHQAWLAKVLKRGKELGEFTFEGHAERFARFIFQALQGALLVKRASGDIEQVHDAIAVIKSLLGVKQTASAAPA